MHARPSYSIVMSTEFARVDDGRPPVQQPVGTWLWQLPGWCPATRGLAKNGKCQFLWCANLRQGQLAINVLRINFDWDALREDVLDFHQLVGISGHEG